MLLKAILLGLWGGFCMFDGKAWHFGFQKPLLAGAGAALIAGNPTEGIMIAATLELMWLGTNNVGVYTPPDIIAGSIVGVAMGVLSGGGVASALAVATPVALLVQQLNIVAQTANIGLAHKADEVAARGDLFSKKIPQLQWLGGLFIALTRIIPIFLIILFGVPFIEMVLTYVPKNVLDGLAVASKMVAAVGFAMLLRILLQKRAWAFLMIGYVLASYLKVPTIGIALVGVVIAYFYDMLLQKGQAPEPAGGVTVHASETAVLEEEEYDL